MNFSVCAYEYKVHRAQTHVYCVSATAAGLLLEVGVENNSVLSRSSNLWWGGELELDGLEGTPRTKPVHDSVVPEEYRSIGTT